ncbi:hypothetical protein PGTUg99_018002 [Puccinia graminis f. sp. tritici]|uniref:Uncharacterized protein n=1 Tax=Puccinia graminis f. sp. tritici TaxID=56615 RepID=A0A5B0S8H3_PUCGR|nr:hypothetical protein PGTUg99_018002 [Puccinia graminis f. sp. tritici]
MENGRLATGQTGPERTDPGWNSALGPPARICLETGYDMRTLRSTHYPLLPGRSPGGDYIRLLRATPTGIHTAYTLRVTTGYEPAIPATLKNLEPKNPTGLIF